MYEKFCPQLHNSIKIHFVRNSHWCVSNSAEGHITLYDSCFSELELHLSITHQLAVIYKPLVECFNDEGERIDPDMDVNIAKVQQQKGVRDCGLFGIAFAYHLAAGDDPEKLPFHLSMLVFTF